MDILQNVSSAGLFLMLIAKCVGFVFMLVGVIFVFIIVFFKMYSNGKRLKAGAPMDSTDMNAMNTQSIVYLLTIIAGFCILSLSEHSLFEILEVINARQ